MKRTHSDFIALALILFCTLSIAAGFLLYDAGQPHYKNNTKYQFSLPETEEPLSSAVSGDEEIVYLSPSGGKYHRLRECSALARSSTIRAIQKEKALLLGKEPCSKCY